MITQKDIGFEITDDIHYDNFNWVVKTGTKFQGTEKHMRDEKSVIVENAIKKFASETKERGREVTGWKSVKLDKDLYKRNTCTRL